ncbi:transposon ty3-I gag-pol polyprotein [Tanacetum coccineum]
MNLKVVPSDQKSSPDRCSSSGVRSTKEMDIAINDLNSKFASMSTVLEEIRSEIIGGGNHPNRKGDERGIHRSRTNFKGFNDNHERNQPLKQVWRHDDILSSDDNEGEETMDEYNRGPMRGDRRRTMVGQNVNPRGYVPKEEQVKVVAYKLHRGAGAWWQREQDNQRAQGIRPVDTWMRMKRMIKGRFLPPDIEQILYQQYHTCVQGKRTIADYTGEFLRLQARCNLRETDEQSMARYISGLNSSIQEMLSLTSIWSVDQAQNLAMKAKRMAFKTGVGFRRFNIESSKSGNDGLIIDEAFQEEDELEYAEPLDGEAE